jgi:N-acetyl-D-muramate 6-phosphate phosphatase
LRTQAGFRGGAGVIVEAVLFDLDGTLADTAPDLVRVLNRMLVEQGRTQMPYAIARNEVSNGAGGLLRLGFGDLGSPDDLEVLRRRFLDLYAEDVHSKSRLFIQLEDINDHCHELTWGVVTNKPEAFTRPLLAALGLASRAGCVVSGDRLPQRKPHPAPLKLAAQELGVAAERCVYVGDAPRDIEAGKNAHMATIAAAYGYIRPREDPHSWGADIVIRRPSEMRAALAELRGRS